MDKHINILIKLLKWYWDEKPLWWDTLSLSKKHTYINYYIYNRLKY